MANALKDAPKVKELTKEEIFLSQTFDANKKYMFELAQKVPEREHPVWNMATHRPAPHKEYNPYRNIVLTSQIIWNGQRRMVRYYDGCDSIFVDEQPKDKETIDQFISQTKKKHFEEGKFGCYGDDRMLLLYMNICSWNADSLFRTRTADAVFCSVNADKKADKETSKLDETEMALQFAKEASLNKMLIHANYIGIPTVDYDSGNDLSEKEIRIEYRKEALKNSANFIKTYGNRAIEIQYYIQKALEKGIISNKFNSNKATWGSNNSEICDISGLRSPEAIALRLFEFSQTEDGKEFELQLRVINE